MSRYRVKSATWLFLFLESKNEEKLRINALFINVELNAR